MKISVRAHNSKASALDLFEELLRLPGDQLLLTSGYLSSPEQLPADLIVGRVAKIAMGIGTWKHIPTASVRAEVRNLARHLDAAAKRLGRPRPPIRSFIGPQWHAKVAILLGGDPQVVHGAIIGSSNISFTALSPDSTIPNTEVDILVTSADGPDAPEQLRGLYRSLANSLKGYFDAQH